MATLPYKHIRSSPHYTNRKPQARRRDGIKGHTYLITVRSYQWRVPSSELLWNNSCAVWDPLSRFSFKSNDRTRLASYKQCSLGANVTVFYPCPPNPLLTPFLPISFLFPTLCLYLKSWPFSVSSCLTFATPSPLLCIFLFLSPHSHPIALPTIKQSILEKRARSWLAPDSTTVQSNWLSPTSRGKKSWQTASTEG